MTKLIVTLLLLLLLIITISVVVGETRSNGLSLTDRDTEEGARYRGSNYGQQHTAPSTSHHAFHLTAPREPGFWLISPPSRGLQLFPHAIV